MAKFGLSAVKRNTTGKGAARKSRLENRIPAVIYGQNVSPQMLEVEAKQLGTLVERGAVGHLITLDLEGTKRQVILKEVQRHAVNGRPLHADLHAVALDRKIHTVVPITIVGEHGRASGERVLVHGAREVTVECLPTAIPEHFEVNVENLEVGESIKASQLVLPAGVALITDPDTMIVAMTLSRAAVESEASEAGAGEAAPAEA